MFGPLVGVPSEAGLAGSLKIVADLETGEGGGVRALSGTVDQGDVVLYGKRLEVSRGVLTWEDGKLILAGLTLREKGAPSTPSQNGLMVSGTVGTATGDLDLGLEGTFDASFLATYLPKGELSGPVSVNLRLGGTSDAPTLAGKAVLNGIDYAPAGGGTPVEALTGTLLFAPGKVSTSGLTFRYAGGVELSGTIGLSGLALNGIRINAPLAGMKSQP